MNVDCECMTGTNGPSPNGNELSLNPANLINHGRMNWGQFKDPLCYLWLPGTVVAFLSLTRGSGFKHNNTFNFLRKIKNIYGKLKRVSDSWCNFRVRMLRYCFLASLQFISHQEDKKLKYSIWIRPKIETLTKKINLLRQSYFWCLPSLSVNATRDF